MPYCTINLTSKKGLLLLAITLVIFAYLTSFKGLYQPMNIFRSNDSLQQTSNINTSYVIGQFKTHKNSVQIQTSEFYDKYFQRILNSFKNISREHYTRRSFRSGETPTVLLIANDKLSGSFWKQQLKDISSGQCPYKCTITENRASYEDADAILLYLRHLKNRSSVESIFPYRDPMQPWIMLTFEAPLLANSIYQVGYHEFNGLFNRTMMFRKDADIIVSHGFIVRKEDAKFLPYEWRVENEMNSTAYKVNNVSVCGMISNCYDRSGRIAYIKQLEKHINVDVYGKCGSLKCGHSMYVNHDYKVYTNKCYVNIGTKYRYFLAFENSICKDYGTEKIYNLLYYPIVPIVLGGINYEEILPPHSYINAAMYSPAELAKYLQFLNDNPGEYNKYLAWREEYIPSTIAGVRIVCDLCARLHDPTFYEYNVVTDFYKWFLTDSKCSRKWTINNTYDLTYQ